MYLENQRTMRYKTRRQDDIVAGDRFLPSHLKSSGSGSDVTRDTLLSPTANFGLRIRLDHAMAVLNALKELAGGDKVEQALGMVTEPMRTYDFSELAERLGVPSAFSHSLQIDVVTDFNRQVMEDK